MKNLKFNLPTSFIASYSFTEMRQKQLSFSHRNPRDAVLSFYNHYKVMSGFTGSFDVVFKAFIGDVCGYYSPFIEVTLELISSPIY